LSLCHSIPYAEKILTHKDINCLTNFHFIHSNYFNPSVLPISIGTRSTRSTVPKHYHNLQPWGKQKFLIKMKFLVESESFVFCIFSIIQISKTQFPPQFKNLLDNFHACIIRIHSAQNTRAQKHFQIEDFITYYHSTSVFLLSFETSYKRKASETDQLKNLKFLHFSSCVIHICIAEELYINSEGYFARHYHLLSAFENPMLILYLVLKPHKNLNGDSYSQKIFQRFLASTVNSRLILVTKAYDCYLICGICKFGKRAVLISQHNFKAIKSLWWTLHENLDQNHVAVKGYSKKTNSALCTIDLEHAGPYDCIIFVLSNIFNFTMLCKGSDECKKVTDIHRTIIMSGKLLRGFSPADGYVMFLLPAVEKFRIFSSLVVLDQPRSLGVTALVRPFDTVTWICLIVLVILAARLLRTVGFQLYVHGKL